MSFLSNRSRFHKMASAFAVRCAVAVFVLVGCRGERETGAEEVGDLAFELLQTVPERTMNDYFSRFITVEEVHQLARDTSLVKERMTRERMKRLTVEEWTAVLIQDRAAVLERGAVAGVRWERMAFDRFTFELQEVDGVLGLDGQLSFSSEGQRVHVHVQALWNGATFRLSAIDDLRAVGN